jgi:hypothetical protein
MLWTSGSLGIFSVVQQSMERPKSGGIGSNAWLHGKEKGKNKKHQGWGSE